MDDPTKPSTPDAQTPEAGTPPAAGEKDGGANASEPGTLDFINKTLKRDFKSMEEAEKSLTHLNSLVGDNAIAEVREKAKEADDLRKIVEAYAEEEGLSYADAKTNLLKKIDPPTMDQTSTGSSTQQTAQPAVDSKKLADLEATVADLKMQASEKSLIEKFPEAASVLPQLKDVAKARGASLEDAYDDGMKALAKIAFEKSQADANAQSTSPKTSSRQGAVDANELQAAKERVLKEDTASAKADLVAKALGL